LPLKVLSISVSILFAKSISHTKTNTEKKYGRYFIAHTYLFNINNPACMAHIRLKSSSPIVYSQHHYIITIDRAEVDTIMLLLAATHAVK